MFSVNRPLDDIPSPILNRLFQKLICGFNFWVCQTKESRLHTYPRTISEILRNRPHAKPFWIKLSLKMSDTLLTRPRRSPNERISNTRCSFNLSMYNDSTTVFVVEILKGVKEIVLIIPYLVVTIVILP